MKRRVAKKRLRYRFGRRFVGKHWRWMVRGILETRGLQKAADFLVQEMTRLERKRGRR